MTARSARRLRGFTMVEMTIAASVFAVLVTVVVSVMNSGFSTWSNATIGAELQTKANRAMETIVVALSPAGASTLVPDPVPPTGASSFTFKRCTGYAAGAKTWTNNWKLEWVAEPTDPTDGIDNDHDGVIDKGMVVLTEDVGLVSQRSTVVVRGVARYLEGETGNGLDDNANGLVDEPGFCVSRSGRTLTIRLTLVRRQRGGSLVQRTVTIPITLRN
jgi:prepilin-type N-terminal cleavage/methylation domain-containing protein